MTEFRNPYTFVPAFRRDETIGDLGDATPAGHHRFHRARWSGQLRVRMTAKTPIVLLDTDEVTVTQRHHTFPVLKRNKRPHLPVTEIKGMLSSAYEAITNSRLRVFADHDSRLGTRMNVERALSMRPGRITADGNHVELLRGRHTPVGQIPGAVRIKVDYTDPLHLKPDRSFAAAAKEFELVHGAAVTVRLERNGRQWDVRAIGPEGGELPDMAGISTYEATGLVLITGQNINSKHYERIFITNGLPTPPVPLLGPDRDLTKNWAEVIKNYLDIHTTAEIEDREQDGTTYRPWDFYGPEPGHTAWSRHLYEKDRQKLEPGSLCWAEVKDGEILGLYPVMIARELYQKPPSALLPHSLHPAPTLNDLSPADRLFGWVGDAETDGDTVAWRGQIRIGAVETSKAHATAETAFGKLGLPLAILGQPKPQQGRFYLADSADDPGEPLPATVERKDWYSGTQGLRGRKFYPHHGVPDNHWQNATSDRTQDSSGRHAQEYRRPHKADEARPDQPRIRPDRRGYELIRGVQGEQRTDQNRSILGWINPKSEFTFTIHVTNLSDVELGALIWLLRLDADHFHRIGYAKPLGFGSVRLELDKNLCYLRTGAEIADSYRTFPPTAAEPVDTRTLDQLEQAYREAASDLKEVLDAYRVVATGDPDTPTHYPRLRPRWLADNLPVPPDPRGRTFEWTGENEAGGKHPLPRATDRGGLPYNPRQ